MKILLPSFLCLICAIFSFGQPMANDLYFTSLSINDSAMEKACDAYGDAFVDLSQKEKFSDDCELQSETSEFAGVSYNSLLDSSVRIWFRGDSSRQWLDLWRAQDCVGPYPEDSTVGTPGTHQFSEVMLFELLRLQEIGVIVAERDSLEAFLQSVIALIKEKNRICPDLDLGSFDEESGSAGSLFGPGCCSLVDSSTTVLKISSAIGDVQIKKISLGKFQINGVPSGTAYALFNLNGQLISKGFVGNGLLEIPVERAVLKLGGRLFLL